jgi:prevent-host-death family protein
VNEARFGGKPVVITDHGKPAAVVISPEAMKRYQALEDAADLAEIEAIKARGPVWVSNEDAQKLMDQWLDEADAAADQDR